MKHSREGAAIAGLLAIHAAGGEHRLRSLVTLINGRATADGYTKQRAAKAIRRASKDMRETIGPVLLEIRNTARGLARESITKTLSFIGKSTKTLSDISDDSERTDEVAASYADAWELTALEAVKAVKTDAEARDAISAAADENAWMLERDATTETWQSYHDEYENVTEEIAAREDTKGLWRIWMAESSKPCDKCEQMDGEEAPWGEEFLSGLVPGDVHPNCRCVEYTEIR